MYFDLEYRPSLRQHAQYLGVVKAARRAPARDAMRIDRVQPPRDTTRKKTGPPDLHKGQSKTPPR
jgi:hypothetical protein